MTTYIEIVKRFVTEAKRLMAASANETKIRDNFTSYLRQMFPTDTKWVSCHISGAETHVHLLRNNRTISGFIDNCIDSTAIEYEKNISIPNIYEEGFRQVKEYCAALIRDNVPIEMVIGVLSDTLRWKVYEVVPVPGRHYSDYNEENIELTEIASFDASFGLDDRKATDFRLFLQKYLGKIGGRQISANKLAEDFGLQSIYSKQYRKAIKEYVEGQIQGKPEYYSMIEDLWAKLVDTYNQYPDTTDFYVQEYYISILAKLLCANLIAKEALSSSSDEIVSIVNGKYFQNRNIENFADNDYFGWLNNNLSEISGTLQKIQDDLKVYDFSFPPEEDVFGRLMVQLADRSQRILLGQEHTSNWIAHKVVEKVISSLKGDKMPQFVDMCCGSGSMVVETIRQTIARISHASNIQDAHGIVERCISGFDIDPLAVMLAKINWLASAYEHLDHSKPAFIPIYHADSLFTSNPMTKKFVSNGKEITVIELLNKRVVVPEALFTQGNLGLFDRIVDKCYDCINLSVARETFILSIKRTISDFVSNESEDSILTICEFGYNLYMALYELNVEGKNGIWAFILKNSFRPVLLKATFNGIVSNTPWLSMSKVGSNPYKEALRSIAEMLGINPGGASFLHLEMATVFLLSSINRYLENGGLFGCILPESVLAGMNHDKFRRGKFSEKGIIANFQEIWELPTNAFKNKSIVLFGEKKPFEKVDKYLGRQFLDEINVVSEVFHVTEISSKSAWTLNQVNQNGIVGYRTAFKQGADIMPRGILFFNFEKDNSGYHSIRSIRMGDSVSYFLQNMKKGRELQYNFSGISDDLIKTVILSNVLTPFAVTNAPQAILPIKFTSCGWDELEDSDMIQYSRSSINLLHKINEDYRNISGKSSSLFDALNWRNKLKQQEFTNDMYLVIYGAGGSNPCAAYIHVTDAHGIVVDQTLYWTQVKTEEEAIYLTAILNCPILSDLISELQPQGSFGERHIHMLPLDFIPRYDSENSYHKKLIETAKIIISELTCSTPCNLVDPNSSTLSSRRKRILTIFKGLPSYAFYEEICKSILLGQTVERNSISEDYFESYLTPSLAAESIVHYGNVDVDLPNILTSDLHSRKLGLTLMYAITPKAHNKIIRCGKLAIGLNFQDLTPKVSAAYECIEYVMIHYWSNKNAIACKVIGTPAIVDKDEIPSDFIRYREKGAHKYLVLNIEPKLDFGDFDILKVQEHKKRRYVPFIIKENAIRSTTNYKPQNEGS